MANNNALIIGGTSGIGLSIALELQKRNYNKVYILGRTKPKIKLDDTIQFIQFNLLSEDYSLFDEFDDIDTLIFSAGFGRVTPFESLHDMEIINSFKVNSLAFIRIVKLFYHKLKSSNPFYCSVIGSIAGLVSSPLFSVYGSTKSSLANFIESINIELEMNGSTNKILHVAPGSIKGTSFNGGETDLLLTKKISKEIVDKMYQKKQLFIPEYDEIYKDVLKRYKNDPHKFGIQSYHHKIENNRIREDVQLKIGYLSGTFDLFHIGHLNLIRNAKKQCDYLVVGIHRDGSHKDKETFIPFDERMDIVKSIKFVDKVIQSLPEDSDVYNQIQYDYLFVGSDYKGTERFKKYEELFKDKGVEIVYFPYTKETSSTQLRKTILDSHS